MHTRLSVNGVLNALNRMAAAKTSRSPLDFERNPPAPISKPKARSIPASPPLPNFIDTAAARLERRQLAKEMVARRLRTLDSPEINNDAESYKNPKDKSLRRTRAVERVKTHTPMATASANAVVDQTQLPHLVDETLIENENSRLSQQRQKIADSYERNNQPETPQYERAERPKGQLEMRREEKHEERLTHREKRLAQKYDKSMYRDLQKRVRFSGLI